MQKTKSFSAYGRNLQRVHEIVNDPSIFRRSAEKFRENPLKISKSLPKTIEGFNKIIGRDKLNPFQIYNTRDNICQANYQVDESVIKKKQKFFPLRREQSARLQGLIKNSRPEWQFDQCKKHAFTQRDDRIMTVRDLQKFRKSYHSIDFNKQAGASHSYIRKPIYNEETVEQYQSKIDQNYKRAALEKVHSFESYSKRDFLSQKKLSVQGAPPQSGSNSFKIPLQKFKVNFNSTQAHAFRRAETGRLSAKQA